MEKIKRLGEIFLLLDMIDFLSVTEDFVLNIGPRRPWSCDANCIIWLQPCDHFLWNSGFDLHEGEEVVKMTVDRHDSTSYLMSVFDGGFVDVTISPPEKLCDLGCRKIMFVYGFIFEQNYVSHLGDQGLVFPDHIESTSCKFLNPK